MHTWTSYLLFITSLRLEKNHAPKMLQRPVLPGATCTYCSHIIARITSLAQQGGQHYRGKHLRFVARQDTQTPTRAGELGSTSFDRKGSKKFKIFVYPTNIIVQNERLQWETINDLSSEVPGVVVVWAVAGTTLHYRRLEFVTPIPVVQGYQHVSTHRPLYKYAKI